MDDALEFTEFLNFRTAGNSWRGFGKQSDGGVFSNLSFGIAFEVDGRMALPNPS